MKQFTNTAYMKQSNTLKGLLALMLAACISAGVQAQYNLSVDVVEEHTGMVGSMDLAGYTTYRIYVDTEQSTDFVSAVFGDQGTPLELEIIDR